MSNFFCKNKRSAVFKPLNNDRIGLINLHTGEGTTGTLTFTLKEVTIIINRHSLWNIKANTGIVVVYTMSRCGVNNTSTIIKSDVICVNKLTSITKITKDWLLILITCELNTSLLPSIALDVLGKLPIGITKLSSSLLCKSLSNNLYMTIRKLKSNVICFWVQNDCLICWHSPWSSSPDVYPGLTCISFKTLWNSSELKANKNSSRGNIVILNLCFRKSCVIMGAPVDRLGSSVHRTLVINCLENLNVSCIIIIDVSEVWIIPLT